MARTRDAKSEGFSIAYAVVSDEGPPLSHVPQIPPQLPGDDLPRTVELAAELLDRGPQLGLGQVCGTRNGASSSGRVPSFSTVGSGIIPGYEHSFWRQWE